MSIMTSSRSAELNSSKSWELPYPLNPSALSHGRRGSGKSGMTQNHPLEPIRVVLGNGWKGAGRRIPAAEGERPLSVPSRDLRRDARQWARLAEIGCVNNTGPPCWLTALAAISLLLRSPFACGPRLVISRPLDAAMLGLENWRNPADFGRYAQVTPTAWRAMMRRWCRIADPSTA